MIIARYVGLRVLAGIVAGMALVGGLVGLATGVEHGRQGLAAALQSILAIVPLSLVWLAPLCCGVGAAVALARLKARGEDVGFAVAGIRPWRTGWVAALVGLGLGMGAWWMSDAVVPHTTHGSQGSTWVWLDQGAYRPADETWVRMVDQRMQVDALQEPPSPSALRRAQHQARPRTAPASVLTGSQAPPLRLEWHSRLARILACAAMALIGWMPLSRRGLTQVGMVLGTGLLAQAIDFILQALAAQGQIPVLVGAWVVPGLLTVWAAWLSLRS